MVNTNTISGKVTWHFNESEIEHHGIGIRPTESKTRRTNHIRREATRKNCIIKVCFKKFNIQNLHIAVKNEQLCPHHTLIIYFVMHMLSWLLRH